MKFCRIKFLTAIWLFALFLNAFSIAIFAEAPKKLAEMVYCPLTKKLQPVKAVKKETRKNPLGEICADGRDKKSFSDELFSASGLKMAALGEKQFENLVFDFFQKGKSAFAGVPQFPDLPHKNSIKPFSAVVAFGQTDEKQFIWKSRAERFSFALIPRPPNTVAANFFEPQNFRELNKISRQITPRAPPFSL